MELKEEGNLVVLLSWISSGNFVGYSSSRREEKMKIVGVALHGGSTAMDLELNVNSISASDLEEERAVGHSGARQRRR